MKTKNLAGMLLLSFLIIGSLAFADGSSISNSTLSEGDQNQLKDFTNVPGATLRMLQLERSVSRNILVGEVVVNITEKNHPDANTTGMISILDDMRNLVDNIEDVNYDNNLTSLAQQFVEFKKESINLTMEFREESSQYLNSTDREEIREAMKNLSDELDDIDSKIEDARRDLNAETIRNLMNAMNVTNTDLIEKIKNGSIDLTEIKKAIQDAFVSLDETDRMGAVKNVRSRAVEVASWRNEIRKSIMQHRGMPFMCNLENSTNCTNGINLTPPAIPNWCNSTNMSDCIPIINITQPVMPNWSNWCGSDNSTNCTIPDNDHGNGMGWQRGNPGNMGRHDGEGMGIGI